MQAINFITPIKPTKEISVIILGSLIPPRCKTMEPKSLRLVNNQPVIYHQCAMLDLIYPNAEKILVVGHKGRQIIANKPANLKIIENSSFQENGSAEEIRLALNIINNHNVIIIGGNVMFNEEIRKINQHNSCILVQDKKKEEETGVSNIGKVMTINYNMPFLWTEIVSLKEKELELMAKFVNQKTKSTYLLHEVITHVSSYGDVHSVLADNDSIYKV